MNLPAAVSTVAAIIALAIAVLVSRLSTAPSWHRMRSLVLAMIGAFIYCATDAFSTTHVSDAWLLRLMHVQGAGAVIHCGAWLTYAFDHIGINRPRLRRAVHIATAVMAVAFLVPGLMLDLPVTSQPMPALGVVYRSPTSSIACGVCFVMDCSAMVVALVLYVRARAHVRFAMLHVVALAFVVVASAIDITVNLAQWAFPFLLGPSFFFSVMTIAVAVVNGFVDATRELDGLSKRLEKQVGERTAELVSAQADLHRAQKLAAVGTLAAGVAHEINNPAAAVAANLDYLRDSARLGKLPKDGVECLDESLEAVQRISKIVRQLLDSSRKDAKEAAGTASISRVIVQALAESRTQLANVEVDSDLVTQGLEASGDESALVQVVGNLLVNAAQAIPSSRADGLVTVRSFAEDEQIVIEVTDNGSGMTEDTRARLFEPFFTTKPAGQGTGLGLPVSLGLVRSMGGTIEVESSPAGTTMRVRLLVAKLSESNGPTSEERVLAWFAADSP